MKKGTKIRRGMRIVRSAQPIVPGDVGAGYADEDSALMSFEEIGKRMGITRGGAWVLYRSALKKLRLDPDSVALLEDAVAYSKRKEMDSVSVWERIEMENIA